MLFSYLGNIFFPSHPQSVQLFKDILEGETAFGTAINLPLLIRHSLQTKMGCQKSNSKIYFIYKFLLYYLQNLLVFVKINKLYLPGSGSAFFGLPRPLLTAPPRMAFCGVPPLDTWRTDLPWYTSITEPLGSSREAGP